MVTPNNPCKNHEKQNYFSKDYRHLSPFLPITPIRIFKDKCEETKEKTK